MKKIVVFLTLPLVALCACNKIDDNNTPDNKVVSFNAVAHNSDETKTMLNESGSGPYTYSMSWTGDESIKVLAMSKEFPDPTEATTLKGQEISSGYDFSNKLSGTSATFSSLSFSPREFKTGDRYLAIYPRSGTFFYERATKGSEDNVITGYKLRCPIPANNTTNDMPQVFNPSDTKLGLNTNIIPVYGFIEKGKGTGFEPNAVQMHTDAAIVKVVLTNNSGAAKKIDHLTMECSGTGSMTGLQGVGTWVSINTSFVETGFTFHVGMLSKSITLNCKDYVMADKEKRAFSFVVLGGQSRASLANLTWKAYEDGNDTPIWTYTNTYGTDPGQSTKPLNAGMVYTVTGSI